MVPMAATVPNQHQHSLASQLTKPAAMVRPDRTHCATLILALLIFFQCHRTTANASTRNHRSLASQFLQPQNAARAALAMRPLVWDNRLARYAEWYANKRSRDCALRHSNGPYGENIFWGSGSGWTPSQAVAAWVGERRWYKYRTNSCAEGEECGHYTQIIWRNTSRVGCAKVTCLGGRGEFITCNYDPPGNYIGERPY